jgi:hypothetical protein
LLKPAREQIWSQAPSTTLGRDQRNDELDLGGVSAQFLRGWLIPSVRENGIDEVYEKFRRQEQSVGPDKVDLRATLV